MTKKYQDGKATAADDPVTPVKKGGPVTPVNKVKVGPEVPETPQPKRKASQMAGNDSDDDCVVLDEIRAQTPKKARKG